MRDEKKFEIRAYTKQELAIEYFPRDDIDNASRKMREWFRVNPRLRKLIGQRGPLTPKQVRLIVEEVGEPTESL